MSSMIDKRILRELKDLNQSKQDLIENGIHFHIDETNIRKIYALFIGQKNTPYENGFFFVSFDFPDNYPWQPPVAKFETQGYCQTEKGGNVDIRFNPNLYTNGKVCLSMLNTWQGPGWTPANTIHNVLIAIQSLVLNELPLQNEPGYENEKMDNLQNYNRIIQYATMKITVIDLIKKMNLNGATLPHHFEFKDVIFEHIAKNYDWYLDFLTKETESPINGKQLDSRCYNMLVKINYDILKKDFEEFALLFKKSV